VHDVDARTHASAEFPAHKIGAVAEAIRNHQPASQPETTEGIIVRKDGIPERVSAVGVLRAVSKTGRDTRYRDFSSVIGIPRQNRASLPEQLRLERSRTLAVPRIQVLDEFPGAARAEELPAPF